LKVQRVAKHPLPQTVNQYLETAAHVRFPPQPVNAAFDPCCTPHKWLVFPLRGSTEFYADAAFFTLRAHTARKPNSHIGLKEALRCTGHEWLF
jgi:hypothetical protein